MNVTLHDFTKPTRLPTDWRHRLTAWCKVALGLASKAWAKELPLPLEAGVDRLDVDYANAALGQLPEGHVGYRVQIAGDRLASMLVLPRTLVVHLVRALLGDKDVNIDPARDLSPIDENLANYFFVEHWLKYFREAWPALPVTWTLESKDANPQCSRCFAPTDTLVTLHWHMTGAWGTTAGQWFFARRGLLEVLGGTDATQPLAIPETQVAARRQAIVASLPVTLEVVLGAAEIKLSQLSHLQVGDVIVLDRSREEGATARAGGVELFRGQVGRQGSWKAFQIDSAVEK
jgi:flagellar motor switch protein FliM